MLVVMVIVYSEVYLDLFLEYKIYIPGLDMKYMKTLKEEGIIIQILP